MLHVSAWNKKSEHAQGIEMKSLVVLFVAGVLAALSGVAEGCGDSLYRVGKGVSYRVYSAPLPGNLLVFGTSEGAKQLADQLAQTGHGVRLVDSLDELKTELSSGDYDVVIAPYEDRATIESASGSGTSFLPVAMNREDEKIARQSYDRVMVPDKHEIKHYLKAIHIALKGKI
jgi:hypothetical protein